MKTINRTFVSLLSTLFIATGAVTPGYAAPTGADCQAKAMAAAERIKKNGGTDKEQQAAYERAKHNCKAKM